MTINLWKDRLTIKFSVLNAEVQIVTIITEAEGVVDRAVAMAVYTTEVTTDGEPIRRDL